MNYFLMAFCCRNPNCMHLLLTATITAKTYWQIARTELLEKSSIADCHLLLRGETHSTHFYGNTAKHILENKSAIWRNFTIGVQVSFIVISEYLSDGGARGWGKGGFSRTHFILC